MEIVFSSDKLQNFFTDVKQLQRKYGANMAKKIQQRLDDLHDVETLDEMRDFPGRCHELKGARAGQLALDLAHPYHLIFEPANDPLPTKEDGGLDWSQVTAVRILEIVDYHG